MAGPTSAARPLSDESHDFPLPVGILKDHLAAGLDVIEDHVVNGEGFPENFRQGGGVAFSPQVLDVIAHLRRHFKVHADGSALGGNLRFFWHRNR